MARTIGLKPIKTQSPAPNYSGSNLPIEARRVRGQDEMDKVALDMLCCLKTLPPKLRGGAFSEFLMFASTVAGIKPAGKGARHG